MKYAYAAIVEHFPPSTVSAVTTIVSYIERDDMIVILRYNQDL